MLPLSLHLSEHVPDKALQVGVHLCDHLQAALRVVSFVIALLIDLRNARVHGSLAIADARHILLALAEDSLFV